MKTNSLKTKLAKKQPCYGAWLSIPSPYSARLLARQPLDFLVLDSEHTPMDAGMLAQMINAIHEVDGPVPIARIAQATVENVKRALDAGAYGVIAPMINSRAEAEQFVAAARFPPQGQRSFGSFYAGLAFGEDMPGYLKIANQQTLAIVQIESRAALDHVDEIFSVPGLDGGLVGPIDLSLSLGLDPFAASPSPVFTQALETILQAAKKHNLPMGIYCANGKIAAERLRQGFLLVNVASDVGLLGGVQRELETAQAYAAS